MVLECLLVLLKLRRLNLEIRSGRTFVLVTIKRTVDSFESLLCVPTLLVVLVEDLLDTS